MLQLLPCTIDKVSLASSLSSHSSSFYSSPSVKNKLHINTTQYFINYFYKETHSVVVEIFVSVSDPGDLTLMV